MNSRRQLRWRACHPKTNFQDSESRAIGLVFYEILDTDIVEKLFLQSSVTETT